MTRVAVLDDWQRVARECADWAPLEARADVTFFTEPFASEDAAATALVGFDVILATRERTPFPKSLIDRLPTLRMFGLTGVRAGKIDLAYLQQRGVVVCYTDGGPGVESTAELALALMLAAARRIPEGDASMRAGRFQLDTPTGFVLAGKTLGLVGLGRIGARMAGYGQALGMTAIAWSQNLTDERATAAGATRVNKDELLGRADVMSLHLVLSARTRGVLGAPEIARMKPGALLINASRGRLVDETALIDAARAERIVAALDVYEREPLPLGSPAADVPQHHPDAAPRLQRRRGLPRVLRAMRRERAGVPWRRGLFACWRSSRREHPGPFAGMRPASLEEWFAIHNVFIAYATSLDACDVDGVLACFEPDCSLSSPILGRFEGFAGLRAFVQRTIDLKQSRGVQFRHVVSNLRAWVDGERAAARCYLLDFLTEDGRTELLSPGEYDASLVRRDGTWRLTRRDVAMDRVFALPAGPKA